MVYAALRRLSLVLASLVFVTTVANADNFNVLFDDSISGSGIIVGTGTFSFTGNLGDGTYYLDTLPGYNIDFTIGSTTFTNADINTSIPDVLVVIYGGGSQFYFDNDGVYGSHDGSLDFDQISGAYLTTEPGYYGSPPLDLYQAVDSSGMLYFGRYGAPVPEPGTLFLLGTGLVGLILRRRRSA